MKRFILIIALVLATTAACHRVRIIRGNGGGVPSPTYFDTWYHNVILGLVDVSGPVDLNQVCGGGAWSEIFIRRSFINSIVWIVGPIWTPTTVTIYCGGGPGIPGGYALEGVVDESTGTFYPAPPKTAATTGKVIAAD